MKKIYYLILLLGCLPFITRAQTPSISIYNVDNVCLQALQKIQFTMSGEVKSDNKFTIQVRKSNDTQILAEVPATLKDGKLEVRYTDPVLASSLYLQLRIVTSSPKTESNWYSFQVFSKGNVELSSVFSDTINAGDDLQIKFRTVSYGDIRVTLNDSTKFYYNSYSTAPFFSYQKITTVKTNTFFIAHAENYCGAMDVSGSVSSVINPTSVRTISATPFQICEDGEVKISISTSGTPLSAQSKFKLRFKEIGMGNDIVPRVVEVNAELKDNLIVGRFPRGFNLKSQQQFNVQVLVDNPKIVGAAGDVSIMVMPYPKAEFFTQSSTINVGDQISLGIQFTGIPPFSADLGNGYILNTTSSGQAYAGIRPDKTISYTLKSFTSGCGTTNLATPQTVVHTVKEGIYVESDYNQKIFCAGTTGRIPILANGNFNGSTKYYVVATFQGNTSQRFEATRNGNFLEFPIPLTEAGYGNISYLKVETTSPAFTSQSAYYYSIQSKPILSLVGTNVYSYDTPGQKSIAYSIHGDGPFVVEDQNGMLTSAGNSYLYQSFYLSKTVDYKLKSISNSCFKNDNLPSERVTLTNTTSTTPTLYLLPMKSPVCYADSVEVSFVTTGNFGEGNVFNIQAYTDCCTFQTIKTVSTGGVYKIKIPESQNNNAYMTIRIAATNPVLFTETKQISVQRLPSQLRLYPEATAQQPYQILKTANPTLTFSSYNYGLTSVVYSDGTSDKTVNFTNLDYNNQIKITPETGKTTAYTFKSATNICGTQTANVSTYIKVLPYQIKLFQESSYYGITYCVGSPLQMNFGIENGDAGNATFSLEIRKNESSNFTLLAKGETKRQFSTTIPKDFESGSYQMRVVSSDGSVSNNLSIQVGAAPTAKLSTNLSEPVLVNANQSVELKLNLTGSSPWTVLFDDNYKQTFNYSPYSRFVNASASKEYSIKNVYNSCGYGEASGKVAVKVKPTLSMTSSSYSVCEGGSFSVNYDLQGDADLTSDYIRFELVDLSSQKSITLDSTKKKSGSVVLKIPGVLSGSYYQIVGRVRSYLLTSQLQVGITTKADLTISGNTIINSGESTRLIIRNNKGTGEAKYVLSDGTTGNIYYGSGIPDNYITVKPTQSTTYTITSASNSCGEGKVSGSAIVEVNPFSERSLSVSNVYSNGNSGYCSGDTVQVYYNAKGTFSSGNTMTVQLSDSTGKNFKSIVTLGNSSPVRAVFPMDLFSGKKYRIRVVASDAGTASGAYEYPIMPSQKAKARFASETVLYDGVNNPKIVVLLEGGSPWQYQYGSDISGIRYRSTYNSSDTISLFQASPNQYYKLFSVSNLCGTGTIDNPSTVRVEVITGEPSITAKIIMGPNPTQDNLMIKFDSALPRTIRLYNMQGTSLRNWPTRKLEEQIDMRDLSPGIYILQIESQGKQVTYKVIKQ
jgi:hypothetical protein